VAECGGIDGAMHGGWVGQNGGRSSHPRSGAPRSVRYDWDFAAGRFHITGATVKKYIEAYPAVGRRVTRTGLLA
jgi:hypothetical protein